MESAVGREPRTHGDWSSDVTDLMQMASNRGRGAAAGVMSGAWWSTECFESRTLGEWPE